MGANPWLVPVTALRRGTGARREERRRGRVGSLRVADSVIDADADVEALATLDSLDGGIEVSAVVSAPWHGECRLCLKPLSGQLRCDVRELYRPRTGGEDTEADEETYPLEGEQLDLQPLVRDALLLELPLAPICRHDCRGLCPQCGADLNEETCSCSEPSIDPRWAALDSLRGLDPLGGLDRPGDASGGYTA